MAGWERLHWLAKVAEVTGVLLFIELLAVASMVQKIKKFFEVLKMVLLLVLFVVLPLRLFVVILQPVVRVTLVGSV